MSASSFVKASAIAITFTALGVLGAFAAGAHVDRPFFPPWSGVAFLAIGFALWLEERKPSGKSIPLGFASGLVVLIGNVTWGEHLFGMDIGFDTLLFPRSLLSIALHPGRPAPVTAFTFVLIGLT